MNKKIAFSAVSIFVALSLMAGATFAFFSSTQTVSGNTISTGTLNFVGVIQDGAGSSSGDAGKLSVSSIAPGDLVVRCLWVSNQGTVPGRFKVYASAESGDNALGNLLTLSVK